MARKFKRPIIAAVIFVKKQIDNNYVDGYSTRELARQAGISRTVLQVAFKARYRTSVGQYKLKLRMRAGAHFLRTGYSIKETANKLQYASSSSFSNAFRNHFKMSPSEFLAQGNEV